MRTPLTDEQLILGLVQGRPTVEDVVRRAMRTWLTAGEARAILRALIDSGVLRVSIDGRLEVTPREVERYRQEHKR